jgi:hypothetical protein
MPLHALSLCMPQLPTNLHPPQVCESRVSDRVCTPLQGTFPVPHKLRMYLLQIYCIA